MELSILGWNLACETLNTKVYLCLAAYRRIIRVVIFTLVFLEFKWHSFLK